jgi:hypothetical protein
LKCLAKLAAAVVVALSLLPVLPAQAKEQRFSVDCEYSHTAQLDPIVNPYGVAAHLHEFLGNKGTSDDPRRAPMLDNGTTCLLSKDTAAYWFPLLHDDGVQVKPHHSLMYYRHNGDLGQGPVAAFPKNLRIITDEAEWLCRDSEVFPIGNPPHCDGSAGHYQHPVGVGLRYLFPRCWVGDAAAFTTAEQEALGFRFNAAGTAVIDSADHRSHMSHNTGPGGTCPAKYPVAVPKLTYNIRYPLQNANRLALTPGAPTFHADFWNTWNQVALETLVTRCLDRTTGPWSGYTTGQWEARCVTVDDAEFALGD